MSKLFTVVLWVAIAGGVIAFLAMQAFSSFTNPLLGLTNVGLGVVYAGIVLGLLRRSRVWPRSGRAWPWVTAAFLWGAGSTLILVLSTAGSVMTLADYVGWDASLASWGGAYPEEFSKALGVIFVCLSFRQLNRPWHGMVAGMVIGLGFEVNENAMYAAMGGLNDPVSDWSGFWITWGARMVLGPGLHILCSGIAGWGIGWALYAYDWSLPKRLAYAFGWLAVAFTAHFIWNYSPGNWNVNVATMILGALILYPTAIRLWLRARAAASADPGYSQATGLRTAV